MKKLGFCAWALLCANLAIASSMDASQLVSRIIQENAAAQSLEAWVSSGWIPEKAFRESTPESLCTALIALPSVQLALFESTLEEHALPCSSILNEKLETYWTEQEIQLFLQQPLKKDRRLRPGIVKEIDLSTEPVLRTGGLEPGQISLTFDDGPHRTLTERVLEALDDADIRAHFFLVGENTQRFPQLVNEIYHDDHMMGSHSWSHQQLPRIPNEEAEAEILNGHSVIGDVLGFTQPYFRFPYGSRNEELQSFVTNHGMFTFFWNIDSEDWKTPDPQVLLAQSLQRVDAERGGIILFHDIQRQTSVMLPYFIQGLRDRNFQTVVFAPRQK